MIEAKVEIGKPQESTRRAQKSIENIQDFLEDGAFVMDLEVCIGVFQLKNDIHRHTFIIHSTGISQGIPYIRHYVGLGWGPRSNSDGVPPSRSFQSGWGTHGQ